MASPVGTVYFRTKQLVCVTPWRGAVWLAKRTALRSLPLQAEAVRPFSNSHKTETSRLNSIAATHWNDSTGRPCLRSAVRSGPSSCADARPRHPKAMGLERRMRKPRYSSSIPFYIERLPTYN
jgi:hypothetical protein